MEEVEGLPTGSALASAKGGDGGAGSDSSGVEGLLFFVPLLRRGLFVAIFIGRVGLLSTIGCSVCGTAEILGVEMLLFLPLLLPLPAAHSLRELGGAEFSFFVEGGGVRAFVCVRDSSDGGGGFE